MKYHDNHIYQNLIVKIEQFYGTGDIINVKITLEELRTISENQQDAKGLCVSYFFAGLLKMGESEWEEAIALFKKSIAIGVSQNETFFLMKAYNALGVAYSEKIDFYTSLQNYLNAYQIAKENPSYLFECGILSNIGNLFIWLDEYEMASQFLLRSYHKYKQKQMDEYPLLATILINLIEVFSLMDDYSKVEKWIEKAKRQFKPEEEKILECILLSTIISINFEKKNLVRVNEEIEHFIKLINKSDAYMDFFRTCLKVWSISIRMKNKETSKKMLAIFDKWNQQSDLGNFDNEFSRLRIEYYLTFVSTNQKFDNEFFAFYYEKSKFTIEEMKKTYIRCLSAELELGKSKSDQKTAMKEKEKLQKDMEMDYFTGIYNKVATKKYIAQLLTKKQADKYQAMLVVDIDYFKRVNDVYGHDVGDVIIVEVAKLLKEIHYQPKIVGRFGGDEFVVFLDEVENENQVVKLVEDLMNRISSIETPNHRIDEISVSIGLCLIESPSNFDEVFKIADQALYHSKDNGKKQFIIKHK